MSDALVDVGHLEGEVDDAVAVPALVVQQRAVRAHAALDDEAGRAGAQHVGLVVAVAVLGAGVGDELHPEGGLVEVRGLRRVADDEDDRVERGHGERVGALVVVDEPDQLTELVGAERGGALVRGEGDVGHGPNSDRWSLTGQLSGDSCGISSTLLACEPIRVDNLSMPDLDALDAALIALFAAEPRVGVLEASRRLGAARGTVQARLDRLSARGVVRGWGPDVDPAAIGYDVAAFVTVELRQVRGHDPVTDRLAEIPEVLEVHTITGAGDLLCRVVARGNADLQRVIDALVAIEGVERTSTTIALASPVPYRTAPLVSASAMRAAAATT